MWTVIKPKHDLPKVDKGQQGSALLWSLSGVGLLGVISYVGLSLMTSHRIQVEDQLAIFQAKLLLSNVLEVGKYLLSQERVVFVNKPLLNHSDRQKILLDLNAQGVGSIDVTKDYFIVNACGGYDAQAYQVGDLQVGGLKVFCPFYWRHPNFDGEMLETALFRHWRESGTTNRFKKTGLSMDIETSIPKDAVLKQLGNGVYELELNLTSALSDSDPHRFWLHNDESFVRFVKSFSPNLRLKYVFTSYFGSSEANRNERFVTLEAHLSINVGLRKMHFHETENFMVAAPTIKDFAIFIPYPIDDKGKPTKSFKEAVKFGDPSTRIFGRVFFHGDIDVPLDDLPEFYGPVFISGRLTELAAITDVNQRYQKIKQKFKRGIIENFPTARLLLDGQCASDGYAVVNHSEIYCKHPTMAGLNYGIGDYIKNLNNFCSSLKVVANSGSYYYVKPPDLNPPMAAISCVPSSPGQLVISGGAEEVQATGTHVYIASPVINFKGLTNDLRVYGVVMGGHIDVKPGTHFYSVGQLQTGLVGIPDATVLGDISRQIDSIQSGVGVPLINMVLWRNAKVGDND